MMHETYAKLDLITPKMLYSTVMCDERTCLWFRKIFSQQNVIERLKTSPEGRHLYGRYVLRTVVVAVLLALSFCVLLFGRMLFPRFVLILGIVSAGAAGGFVAGLRLIRQDIASLAVLLFQMDRALVPAGTTLFQMGEIYSRHYGVPSLVSVIWVWDQSLRNVFLLSYIAAFGVFFLSCWESALWVMAGCFVAVCVIKIAVLQFNSADNKRIP
jgi:hypothetical protein